MHLPTWADQMATGSHKQFVAKLAECKITFAAFALYVNRSSRTITRWASGRDNIPAYAWAALEKLSQQKAKTVEPLNKAANENAAMYRRRQRRNKRA